MTRSLVAVLTVLLVSAGCSRNDTSPGPSTLSAPSFEQDDLVVGLTNASNAFQEVVPLPNGWRPEGIAAGAGPVAYVGSLADGAIYRANLITGEGEVAVPGQAGRVAVGLAYDARTDYIFTAGGPGGGGWVYSAATGESIREFQFTAEPSFVNDVIVTRDAAYFTDSFRPFLYEVPLASGGRLPTLNGVQEVPLGGDFVFVPGAFNTNGIEVMPDGKSLIIVHSARAELYMVDPETGSASLIDLGGDSVPNGDGLLLRGNALYVMQNRLNQIAVIELNRHSPVGMITGVITNPNFDVPTTMAAFGNAIYAVNARFGTPPQPDTAYDIIRVTRPHGGGGIAQEPN